MAAILVKYEPNYSAGMDEQVFKNIQRIDQDRACTIGKGDCPDERTVLDRAEKKAMFIHREAVTDNVIRGQVDLKAIRNDCS